MSNSFNDQPSGRADKGSEPAASDLSKQDEEAAWEEAERELSRVDTGTGEKPKQGRHLLEEPSSVLVHPHRARRVLDSASPIIMVETAFLASAASLIWLVNYYFPMGPLLQIFFPVPIALIYLRWNSRAAWMGALVSALLLSVLMGPARSILYVVPYGLLGVLLGVFWQRRASWGIAIAIGSLLCTFGFFFRIWLVSLLLGDDLWLYATAQVTDFLDWLFVKLGLVIQPNLWMVQIAVTIMVFLRNIVYMFVVHLAAWYLLDRLGNPISRPPRWVQVLMDYE